MSLTVVGRNPSRASARGGARAPASRVTGTVDDVRPFVAEAAVCVVPLRVGGGTRLKIFEALAMGKAVVSTTVGAEGLPLVPGEHFVAADEPAAFARAVVALLRDPARAGASARPAAGWSTRGTRGRRWRVTSRRICEEVRGRTMRVERVRLGYVGCVNGACLAPRRPPGHRRRRQARTRSR